MHGTRTFSIVFTFFLVINFMTGANIAVADDSPGGFAAWSAKLFGRDNNWKAEKEKKYREKFKTELDIEDLVERIDFSSSYVEVYHAELNDKPTVMFIARTKSGRSLLDIIYDENDMYKYYQFQKLAEDGKRQFLQDSFAKYKVNLASSEDHSADKKPAKLENQAAIFDSSLSESPSVQSVAPENPGDPQAFIHSTEEQSIKKRLRTLNSLREDGLITQQEFNSIRERILSEL